MLTTMLPRMALGLLLSGVPSFAADYSARIRPAISDIRKDISRDGMPRLQGHSFGYPGHSGAYPLNFPTIYGNATMRDIELMLKDSNPVVRLVAAMVVINRGLDPNLLSDLAHDSAFLLVGPFPLTKEDFRRMKVSEVLSEMEDDPRFQLRMNFGESVRMDYIVEKRGQGGSKVVVAGLPGYPFEMARAGIVGEVTANVIFESPPTKPLVRILKSTHREFEEATMRALSKWELRKTLPESSTSPEIAEFECRMVFSLPE